MSRLHQASDTNADAVVDATARLVHSIAGARSSSSSAGAADRLLPLARRILTSSVGGGNAAASNHAGGTSGTGGGDRLVRRRIEKSYRRSLLGAADSGSALSALGADDPVRQQVVEREVSTAMAEVDGGVSRLAVAEGRHRTAHGLIHASGKESAAADGVVRALSRLVGTEGWEAAAGITAGDGRPMTNDITTTTSTSAAAPTSRGDAAPSSSLRSNPPTAVSQPEPLPRQQSDEVKTVLYEEMLILRDCLFALQGIDSERICFYDPSTSKQHDSVSAVDVSAIKGAVGDSARDCTGVRVRTTLLPFHMTLPLQMDIRSDRVLGSGSMDALRLCGEAGWLYRRVSAYVDSVRGSHSRGGGAVGRALASALSVELAEYHRLISILEAQLTSQIGSPAGSGDGMQQRRLDKKVLTIRQLIVHLRPTIVRLRTLAAVVESLPQPTTKAGGLCSGGKLISAIQQHSCHGDTRHSSLLHSLVAQASDPWFEILWRWTTNGALPAGSVVRERIDSSGATGREFFVAEDLSVPDAQLWHGRYVLLRDNIPLGVISMDLAERALVLGKGLNFIRSCLGDVRWELEMDSLQDLARHSGHEAMSERTCLGYRYDATQTSSQSGYGHTSSPTVLGSAISRMAKQVNSHILQSLRDKHHLQTHLWALKQFLLLGRGDFVSALLDGLHRELDSRSADSRRVGSGEMDGVYVHTLMSVVETALRTTNAKHLPSYVLERLSVNLIAANPSNERPDAWDAFHLAYIVDAPLTAVVHPEATSLYQRVFALLFRLKRIVYMLNRTWRQSTALHHALRQISLAYPDSCVEARKRTLHLLRRVALTRQSILHFASNLQSYLMFEVVEGGYEVMADRVAKATSLDEVIAAHDEYLQEIMRKSLVETGDEGVDRDGAACSTAGGGVEDSPASTQTPAKAPSLGKELTQVLDASLRFCRVHSALFEMALTSVDKATKARRAAERRAKAGDWGYDDVDRDVDGSNLFESLSDESQVLSVESIANEFDAALGKLLAALDRTLNEGPAQTHKVTALGMSGTHRSTWSTCGASIRGPWWRRGGAGVAGGSPLSVAAANVMMPVSWSNDDSLRCLAFRLDFNEYYDRTGFGGTADTTGSEDGDASDDEEME